ncbi:aminoglycoside phosphotransferase family protein [Nonomuraea sp. NBC_01738]|uniref:aminoglycoside phosphotransferase family protein n=1 Tax=Nonomuraea sp. NBC_01738 TaxID=2976003 RepID=UPI002E0EA68C|nr:aminoglycoside phosphotransferase family protein [Nonomuraea sp. NBC_01738]
MEALLGGPVVEAVTQAGGFSPGAAVRVRGGNGRRAFVKAVTASLNTRCAELYRDEARAMATLPETAPAPRLLDSFEIDEWIILVFQDIEGRHPVTPWVRDELDLVLDVVGRMADALTPAPSHAPEVGEMFGGSFTGWQRLTTEDTTGVDPWAVRNLDALAELESGWAEAARGDTLLHGDLRSDNILISGDEVYVVDWAYPCVGAPWFDVLGMLPSITLEGGPRPAELLTDPDPRMTSVLAAITGYFVRQSRQPPPPGIPTVRAFQAAQGEVALDWLRERTGWA